MRSAQTWPRRVLGVDPGCRFLGSAVIEGDELVHHAIHDIGGGGSRAVRARARRALRRLLDAYQPAVLVVERAFFSPGAQAPLLRLLTSDVERLGRARGLVVRSVAPSSLKKLSTGNGHATKQDVAQAMCRVYPELQLYVGAPRKWKTRVQSNRFDAIALAWSGLARDDMRSA